MRTTPDERGDAPAWDVAHPGARGAVPGVRMAGFHDRGGAPIEIRVVPQPTVIVAIGFGGGSPVMDDGAGRLLRGSFVAGLGAGGRRAVRLRGANLQGLQMRLSPLIVRAVLGYPAAELDGAVVTLDDLWGREAARIREQLDDAASWRQRFALADALLARRLAAHQRTAAARGPWVDPEVAHAWRRMVASRGSVRVESLAADVGWSRKRLWARFHAQIGLPPKRMANLVRFDHAVHRLVAGQAAARVAAESGYADQSHLHREVVAMTGATPGTVAREPWLAIDEIAWGPFLQDRGW